MQVRRVRADIRVRPYNSIKYFFNSPMSPFFQSRNVELLKKYRHRSNVTACAIKFIKTVGADLYIRPKVEFLHKFTRFAPLNHGYA